MNRETYFEPTITNQLTESTTPEPVHPGTPEDIQNKTDAVILEQSRFSKPAETPVEGRFRRATNARLQAIVMEMSARVR